MLVLVEDRDRLPVQNFAELALSLGGRTRVHFLFIALVFYMQENKYIG